MPRSATKRHNPNIAPHDVIIRLAKAASRELQSGELSGDAVCAAGPMLAEAGVTPAIVDCLLTESRRARQDEAVIAGCVVLLSTALEALRLASNDGDTAAKRAIENVRAAVATALGEGDAEPAILMLLGRAFAQAGLDAGSALQQALVGAMETHSAALPSPAGPADFQGMFDDLAEQLGHDPFAIHAELADTSASLPAEHRAAMAQALARSRLESARGAALGFVLVPDARIAEAVLATLAEAGRERPVSSLLLERLVRMRPWVPEARQAPLDAAVRQLRPRATTPAPIAAPEVLRAMATLYDGSGAQSLFALVRQGRRFGMAGVLLKTDAGIADAWVRSDMSKREADAMTREIVETTDTVSISLSLLTRRLADALALNVAAGAPPPFGLVQVVEALSLAALRPHAEPPLALAESLLAELPSERRGPAAELAAQRASADWGREYAILDSWFEAGEAVEALLRPLPTRKQRVDAVLTRLLPSRRAFWAECCARMAAILKDGAAEGDERWCEFALVARGLASEQPLGAMPLAHTITAATVEAFLQR